MKPNPLTTAPPGHSVLLVTGAAGNMGGLLRPRLARDSRLLRLVDVVPVLDPVDGEEAVTASVTDAAAMAEVCVGVDAVLHLGGLSGEGPWEDILAVNVDGTRNVLEGARGAGVRRVILASSNHAVGFYPRDDAPDGSPLRATVPPRPDTYYGFSKAAMEALGSLYADRFDMDIVCVRIGTCFPEPSSPRALATWLSPGDAARMVEACLSAPPFGFRIIWGVSANTRRWWSLEEGRELGFHPQDDAEEFARALIARYGEPDPADPELRWLGGPFCTQPVGESQQSGHGRRTVVGRG